MALGPTTTFDPGPALVHDAEANPKSYVAQIAYARDLLEKNEYTDAIHEFGAAAELDPSQPEPPTYAGWAGASLAQQVPRGKTRDTLLSASLERINEVIEAHPKYPDVYVRRVPHPVPVPRGREAGHPSVPTVPLAHRRFEPDPFGGPLGARRRGRPP